MSIIQGNTKVSAGGYQIDQSIRFNDNDSAYLSRTFGTPTDATNWTFSAWVKRCNLGTEQWLFNSGASAAAYYIRFESTDKIRFRASTSWDFTTTEVFRDVGAWYHIVATFENGAVTLYVNNDSIATASVSDATYNFFTNIIHSIGGSTVGASNCDIYLAETYGIDGQALAPTNFGEYNDDGVWVPKAYEGTYGNNGFYLKGQDSAALGDDSSGNGNDFTSSGLTASDQVPDSPTDSYCVMSPLTGVNAGSSVVTQANGNLEATMTANYVGTFGTLAANSGKYYFEYSYAADANYNDGRLFGGVVCVETADHSYFRIDGGSFYRPDKVTEGNYMIHHLNGSGQQSNTGTSTSAYNTNLSSASATGGPESGPDIYMVAMDLDNNNLYWGKNGTWYGASSTSGSDYTDATPIAILAAHQGKYFAPAFGFYGATSGTTGVLNCGQDATFGGRYSSPAGDFYYTPPTGFSKLSTSGLAAPTVADGSKYFNSYTWTGNGASQRIASFQPITETYTIDNAARFNDDDSAYLSDTQGTATDSNRWTWSAWVKRGLLGSNTTLFNVRSASTDAGYLAIKFLSSDQLYITGWYTVWKQSTEVFKDASLWNHIVVAADTDQVTAADRIKIYVNGRQLTSFSPNNNPSSGSDIGMNTSSAVLEIGRDYGGSQYLDAYLANVHFIDGQQLAPSNFGQTDSSTNRWIPKAYSGSYGNNGFFLEFGDSAALGDDTSGNTNDFTSSGLTAADQVTDTPTENYATLNPNDKNSSQVPKDGNLYFDGSVSTGGLDVINGTLRATSGKYYWESTITNVGSVAVAGVGVKNTTAVGRSTGGSLGGVSGECAYLPSGNKNVDGSSTAYGSSFTTGDVIGVALDCDANTVTFYKNNVSQGAINYDVGDGLFPAIGQVQGYGAIQTLNFGQTGGFTYTPPTGFVALNQDNLPLTGGNISAFSWIKSRSSASYSHQLYDRVPADIGNSRGVDIAAAA